MVNEKFILFMEIDLTKTDKLLTTIAEELTNEYQDPLRFINCEYLSEKAEETTEYLTEMYRRDNDGS